MLRFEFDTDAPEDEAPFIVDGIVDVIANIGFTAIAITYKTDPRPAEPEAAVVSDKLICRNCGREIRRAGNWADGGARYRHDDGASMCNLKAEPAHPIPEPADSPDLTDTGSEVER